MALIEARRVSKHYRLGGQEIKAVDELDLSIDRAEFLAVMGPSGSGKTTLLNLLGCLASPDKGSLKIDGEETAALSKAMRTKIRREKVGFIFQEFNLIPILNAVENVELPLKYQGATKDERRRRANIALERVGLSERAKHKPSQMSGGEQQRVAIARALAAEPAIVLADEPTGELDTENTSKLLELLKDLNRDFGQTFVIVTHDPAVSGFTNRVVRLRDGKVESDSA
ncbi:MAG: ABC transporter ATP-binding protein [Actinobacteria bacterium]|nr:ABC transporter ATP-binding protein [Actinomycetota bacterium]